MLYSVSLQASHAVLGNFFAILCSFSVQVMQKNRAAYVGAGKGHILQRRWWHNTAKGQTVNLLICNMLMRVDDEESFVG